MMSVFVCLFGQCCSHRKMTVNCILFCVNNISFLPVSLFHLHRPCYKSEHGCQVAFRRHRICQFYSPTQHRLLNITAWEKWGEKKAWEVQTLVNLNLTVCCIIAASVCSGDVRGPPLLFPTLSSLCHLLCEIERENVQCDSADFRECQSGEKRSSRQSFWACLSWVNALRVVCLVLSQTASLYS